ncbi:MAG: hypothetical protein H0W96_12230 [Solirubrobacterales bacterium]|nr:hypothetical protein [Solirubrobacterales bacterium]
MKVSERRERIPGLSLALLATAIVLTLVGVAGFILHSFAFSLALLLAALFGVSGAASVVAKSPRQRRLLLVLLVAVAVATTYVFLVSGGGPPAPTRSR